MAETKKKKKKSDINDLINNIAKDRSSIEENIKNAPTISSSDKSNIFAPDIHPDDSKLVRLVKKMLKEKQLCMKELLPKFSDTMEMNNYKRSLKIHQTMSYAKFEKWMEVLDCECKIIIKPKGYFDAKKKQKRKH